MLNAKSSEPPTLSGLKKRVAVIGAGPAGLVTLRELLAMGHDAVAFERQPRLGGVYASHYKELQLTTSSINTAFGTYSDGSERSPRMWTGREYLAYLNGYARHFSLHPRIHLSTNVETLRLDPVKGTWTLRASSRATGVQPISTDLIDLQDCGEGPPAVPDGGQTFEFDHVAICSGVNIRPVLPPFPGVECFQGTILHSSEVRNAEVFRGRRVLIVGLGESGSDIALMAAEVAKSCAISTRRGPGYIIQRYFAGKPTDLDTNRCYHAIPRWLVCHPAVRLKVRIEELFLGASDDTRVLRKAKELNKTRGLSPFHRFGTKNTSFVEAMLYHDADYKPDVARVGEERVDFVDGTSADCDLIVYCTGYTPGFPFLEEHHPELAAAGKKPRSLFKHMIFPELGTRAAWIGLVRPGIGSIPPAAELQARYFALLVSGERVLPSAVDIQEDTERAARLDEEQYPEDAGRLNALTDYLRFLDGMATVIGCQPPLGKLFLFSPKTWAKVMFGPLNGAQYRLVGPGAEPELARAILSRVPTMPWPVLAWEAMFLFGSKTLHLLGAGERFKPIGV
jgi:dimethylaniline monooxygenase (N-oxide forming)